MQSIYAVDVILFLWLIAGIVWGIVFNIREVYASDPDEVLELQKTNASVHLPWITSLFFVGVPFLIYAKKNRYKTIGAEFIRNTFV